ncbi:MAG: hypothetical protein M1816_006290 [Peltula sp. TS41687]|nr:MAG: hypothetical protein M1816_006290 [Peltula sp. TS41687]
MGKRGDSRLKTSAASSIPSGKLHDNDANGSASAVEISKTMEEEEKRMEETALGEERERNEKLKKEREEDLNGGEEIMDSKFKRLQYLLGQSKVYSSILMSKIQQQREAAKAAEEKEEETKRKRAQAEEKNNNQVSISTTTRKTARGAATRSRDTAAQAKTNDKKGIKVVIPSKKLPTKSKDKKKDALNIADYFKKNDIGEGPSVTEALEQAADQEAANPTGLEAQESLSARQPDLMTGGVMRSYQLEGLEWLISLYENGLNGILADEMGLGKTIQTISFLAFLRSKKTYGPFLIAAPLSTLGNWVEEFARWTPDIPVVLYHGTKLEREELRSTKLVKPGSPDFPVVCTSYEICMNDRKFLSSYGWKFIIIDEGHRLKNLNCRLVRELKSYNSANRLLITGTPLQNNLSELWSLLNFLMPEIFDQLESFESWFDFSALKEKEGHKEILVGERKNHIISSLHAILKPFLLRRVKADVETSLPKKREYILYAPLTGAQKELYRHILEGDSRAYLEGKVVERINSSRASTPKSTNGLSLKRKAGSRRNTPNKSVKSSRGSTPAGSFRSRTSNKRRKDYRETSDDEFFKDLERSGTTAIEESTVDEEEQEAIERAKTIALAKREISAKKLQNPIMQLRLACNSPHNFYWPWSDGEAPDTTLTTSSGKMLLLDQLIPALFSSSPEHKVLIFSQFKTQLDILESWAVDLHHWPICRIDGSVPSSERRSQIHAFNTDPTYRIFLLSTRAGGQGINLAAADTVILYDSDWNPQQDLQAQDRAHRIGQTRPVIVYRLATKHTVEETLLEKADGKRRLEKLVIQRGKFRSLIAGKEKDDLDELRRVLLEDDFEKFDVDVVDDETGEGQTLTRFLSERDVKVLTDRSDEAYLRAEKGEEGIDGPQKMFKVVETKIDADGNGILATLAK